NDVALLGQALRDAERAVDVASGAGDDVLAEAVALRQDVKDTTSQATKNDALRNALLNVTEPRETEAYQKSEGGVMIVLGQLSADRQFAAAFRRWGADIDREPVAKVAARLGAQPRPVVQEVVAGLDEWALERRRQGRPEAAWRRPHDL